jgi:hypothetical protein
MSQVKGSVGLLRGCFLSAEIKAAETWGILARFQWLSGGMMRVLLIATVVVGPDRLRVDGRLRAALRRTTDGSTMSTSMGMEATSFSEQATAAAARLFRRL